MKIVIAACNARFTHSSLAIRCLRNALEAAGAGPVDLREYWITQDRIGIIQDLVATQPDALLLSVQVWNSDLVAGLLPDLRRLLPDCLLILGGPEVSYNAGEWLERCPEINLVVIGAGEGAMECLVRAAWNVSEVAPDRTLKVPPPDFTRSALPYREADFSALRDRYLYYESSRGCPFACAYCLSSRDDQHQVCKDAATTCTELDQILGYKPMLVKLVDRTFNADPARARQIWRHLIKRATPDTAFHFEIHPALLEDADFAVLAEAPPGLFRFEIGIQSVNPKPLAAISRPVNWPAVRESLHRLRNLGTIHIHLDLIAGLPHEGMAEIGESFDAIMELAPQQFQLGFLKGLHGTSLRERAGDWEMIFSGRPPYQILSSHWLSVAEFAELARIEQLVDNIVNTHFLESELAEAARIFGSSFRAFRHLAEYCVSAGFDIRTRQAAKLRELYAGWRQEWPV